MAYTLHLTLPSPVTTISNEPVYVSFVPLTVPDDSFGITPRADIPSEGLHVSRLQEYNLLDVPPTPLDAALELTYAAPGFDQYDTHDLAETLGNGALAVLVPEAPDRPGGFWLATNPSFVPSAQLTESNFPFNSGDVVADRTQTLSRYEGFVDGRPQFQTDPADGATEHVQFGLGECVDLFRLPIP